MAGNVILIVVDQPALRVAFNQCLRTTDHHLVFSFDGEDGFDRFREVKPHLIIADVHAPRLDGEFLCQSVRKEKGGDRVPFFLLGAELNDPSRAASKLRSSGADGVIPVPFDVKSLFERIGPSLAFGRQLPELRTEPNRVENLRPEPQTVRGDLPSLEGSGDVTLPHRNERPPNSPEAPVPLVRPVRSVPPLEGLARGPRSEPAPSRSKLEPPRALRSTPPAVSQPEAVTQLDSSVEELGGPMVTIDGEVPPLATFEPLTQRQDALESAGDDEIPTGVGLKRPELRPYDPLEEPDAPIPLSEQQDRDEDTRVELVPPEAPRGDAPEPDQGTSELELADDSPPSSDPEPPAPLESFSQEAEAGLLEEPMLPDPAERGSDGLLEELPAEATPSDLQPVAGRAEPRARKGLDESQLGRRLTKRVRSLWDALDQLDYYDLLGVSRDATRHAIREAYFSMSLELHPDRFFFVRSGDLKEKIYAVYRRVGEAYSVLSDERRRPLYDEQRTSGQLRLPARDRPGNGLRSEPPKKANRPDIAVKAPEAKKLVEHAVNALSREDRRGARLYFMLASVYERGNKPLERVLEQLADA